MGEMFYKMFKVKKIIKIKAFLSSVIARSSDACGGKVNEGRVSFMLITRVQT